MPLSQVLFVSGLKQGARWCFVLLASINNLFPDTLCVSQIAPGICSRERDRPGLQPALAVCRRLQPATAGPRPRELSGTPGVRKVFLGCRTILNKRTEILQNSWEQRAAALDCACSLHHLRRETTLNFGGSRHLARASRPCLFSRPDARVGKSRSRVAEQGAEGLYIMPTRVTCIESNPDDYICNLITAGLFLELAPKA